MFLKFVSAAARNGSQSDSRANAELRLTDFHAGNFGHSFMERIQARRNRLARSAPFFLPGKTYYHCTPG